jgi:hypothetical protein
MHLVESPPSTPLTQERLAAFEFESVRCFRHMSKEGRHRRAHDLVDAIRPMAVLAAEVCALEKHELVKKVEEHHGEWGPFLMMLAEAGKEAGALLDLLAAAEMRMAVALAIVEPNQDE